MPLRNKTSSKKIALNEKHREWLDLRKQGGWTYQAIADAYGVKKQSVQEVVSGYMKKHIAIGVEDLRASENEKLDIAEAAIWKQVLKGDLKAVDVFIRLSRRRADLNGLDSKISLNLNLTETTIEVVAIDYHEQLQALAPKVIEGSMTDVQSDTGTEVTETVWLPVENS